MELLTRMFFLLCIYNIQNIQKHKAVSSRYSSILKIYCIKILLRVGGGSQRSGAFIFQNKGKLRLKFRVMYMGVC